MERHSKRWRAKAREDVQFLSHLPKYMIAYVCDQHMRGEEKIQYIIYISSECASLVSLDCDKFGGAVSRTHN